MKHRAAHFFAFLATLLAFVLSNSSSAMAQATAETITLQAETPAGRSLMSAETPEELRKKIEILSEQVNGCTDFTQELLKDCKGFEGNWQDYKRCEGCGAAKKKAAASAAPRIDACVAPAVKQGHSCECPDGPLFVDQNGVPRGKPKLVKTKGPKPWITTYTCTYSSDDLEAYAAEMKALHERLCIADSVPFLNRAVDELETDGEDVTGLRRIEGEPVCKRTGEHIVKIVDWMNRLRLNRNEVPPFDRDAWEDAYKLLHRLETGYQDLLGGLSELCKPKSSKEPMAVACKGFKKGFGDEVEAIHNRNDKQDELLANHEARLTAVEGKVDDVQDQIDNLPVGQWKLGVGAYYLGRFGENVPQSGPGVVAVFGYRSFTSASSGWSADVRLGYTRSTNEDDGDAVGHYTFGGKGAYLYALNDERTTLLSVGVGVNAEVVEEGTNAVNVLPQIGLDLCPGEMFCFGPYAGLGLSYTTQEYMDRSDRSGELKSVPAWTFGLDLTFLFGGRDRGDRAERVVEEPAPSRSRSTTRRFGERSETRSVDTSVPIDKGYRE